MLYTQHFFAFSFSLVIFFITVQYSRLPISLSRRVKVCRIISHINVSGSRNESGSSEISEMLLLVVDCTVGCFNVDLIWSLFVYGGHWTDLSQTCTHIDLWLLFGKIWSELPWVFTSTGWGKNPLFWDRLWTL